MQTIRARRIEMNGNGSAPGGSEIRAERAQPQALQEPGEVWCSLELTDQERALVEEHFRDLTRREREVIFALCSGGTNEGMAERLCIALPTLRTHLMRLNQKLGTSSKGDVVRLVAAHLLRAYRSQRIRGVGPGVDEGRPSGAGAVA